MAVPGRAAVTDREIRTLFGPLHVGGHRTLKSPEIDRLWEDLKSHPAANDIIMRRGLNPGDLPHLYQRFHDLITQ